MNYPAARNGVSNFNRLSLRIIISIAAIFLIVGVILLVFRVIPLRQDHGPEKERLRTLLNSLDSSFWKNPSQSIKRAGYIISLASKTGDSSTLSKAMLRKAGFYQMLDQSDSSLYYYNQSLKIAEYIRNDSLIAKCKNGIANYYLRKEEYQKAIFYLTDALKISERIGYKHVTGLLYNGLGLVSISLKEYDKAIGYFKKAKALCQETGDLNNEAGISLNIGNCYAEIKDYSKARDFYRDNMVTLHKFSVPDTSQIILTFINLAIVDRSLGEIRSSFNDLDTAFALLAKFRDQSLLCSALLERGSDYFAINDRQSARKNLIECYELSTGTIARTNSMEALFRLSELEEKEGNYALSLRYFKRFSTIKDSVMNDETRKSVAEIQLKYDVQKKEYENILLSKKYELQKKGNLTLGIIFGSFIVFVLLIGLLIWLSHKNLKKSFKLQEVMNEHLQEKIRSDEKINELEKLRYLSEIEAKNKELTTISCQLVTKNKILSDISRMAAGFYEEKAMNQSSYNGLTRLINENLNSDSEWKQFKKLFEKVHVNFFTRIKENYPELTEHELRLCAYLKINLQNKEIAKLLNVSPGTITTTRYRIRKKLKLDNKIILEDFLRNF